MLAFLDRASIILYHNGQIPRNGPTLGLCLQKWGSQYYMILNIVTIDGLYSVIWYIDIITNLYMK